MILISANSLGRQYAGGPVFLNVALEIRAGERIGLVGPNGAGKTTLMKLLDGLETPEYGHVRVRPGVRVSLLRQQPEFGPDETLMDVAKSGLASLLELQRELEEAAREMAEAEAEDDRPGYRRYRIKTVAGVDDFASIREVITRRIRGLQERDEPFPDVLLIDGGKGQLSSAMAAFEALKIVPPTVVSLAKREEEIFVPGRSDPIVLRRRSFALRLLQYVRDEAHRFAQHYHHLLRTKKTIGDEP